MHSLYPEIGDFNHGLLPVSDGHQIYFEESGNNQGEAVLVVHGGPGAGCSPASRRFFDPEFYRIVQFDQRGCGQSLPYGDLTNNHTDALIADMEALRHHLGIKKWALFGGSWGSTLALLYAQKHPEVITGMILRGSFLARQQDYNWLYEEGASRVFPEYWQEFKHFADGLTGYDLLQSYSDALHSDNELVAMQAARQWATWEAACATLKQSEATIEALTDPHTAVSMARISSHYFLNHCFIEENQILENMNRLSHIPAILVHGRYDMVCPADQSVLLAESWPSAQLHLVREAGHSAFDAANVDALVRATRDLYRTLTNQ